MNPFGKKIKKWTNRQLQTAVDWIEDRESRTTLREYYLMQIALEVQRVPYTFWGKKFKGTLENFELVLKKRSRKASKTDVTKQAQSKWAASVGAKLPKK